MAIVIMVGCVVLWAVIQANMADQGIMPRSRGSLRYQRRKARQLGVEPESVEVKPRAPSTWPSDEPNYKASSGSLAKSFIIGCAGLVAIFGGLIVIAASGISADWWFAWVAIVLIALWIHARWNTEWK